MSLNSEMKTLSDNCFALLSNPNEESSQNQEVDESVNNEKLLKRPYLKKGEGTARFNMKSCKGFRKKKKLRSVLPQTKLIIKPQNIQPNFTILNHPPFIDKEKESRKRSTFEELEEEVAKPNFSPNSSRVKELLIENDDTSFCSTPISTKVFSPKPNLIFNRKEARLYKDGSCKDIYTETSATLIYPFEEAKYDHSNQAPNNTEYYTGKVIVDLPLSENDGKHLGSSYPKVKFCEEGAEVLEFTEQGCNLDTDSQINESDLISLSDLDDLAATHGNCLANNKGTYFSQVVERVTSQRMETRAPSPIPTGKHIENSHVFKGNKLVKSYSDPKTSQSHSAIQIIRKPEQRVSEPANKGKNELLSKKNEEIDLEAHKLLLLSKVNELTKEINLFKEKKELLERELDRYRETSKQYENLELKLSKVENEKKNLSTEIKKLKKDYSSLKAQNDDILNENGVLKSERTSLKSENERLKNEISSLLIKIDKYKENERKVSSLIPHEEKENVKPDKEIKKTKNSKQLKKNLVKSISNTEVASKKESAPLKRQNSMPFTSILTKNSQENAHMCKKKVHFYPSIEKAADIRLSNIIEVEDINLENHTTVGEENHTASPGDYDGIYDSTRNFLTTKIALNCTPPIDNKKFANFSSPDWSGVQSSPKNFLSGIEETEYANGGKKKVYPNGIEVYHYKNGNKKTVYNDRTIYVFAKEKITREVFKENKEVIYFANGQQETYYKDGSHQIIYPDNSSKTVYRDGKEVCVSSNGAKTTTLSSSHKIVEFPNGQKEIYQNDTIQRVFPDGTIKILYKDGSQETHYNNGKVRFKDRDGNVKVIHSTKPS